MEVLRKGSSEHLSVLNTDGYDRGNEVMHRLPTREYNHNAVQAKRIWGKGRVRRQGILRTATELSAFIHIWRIRGMRGLATPEHYRQPVDSSTAPATSAHGFDV